MISKVFMVLAWVARLLLAAFFCFVGYWKALGPAAALVEHKAWVAGFPLFFARAVGWSEIALALLLLATAWPRLRKAAHWAAPLLVVNQLVAGLVHISRRELDALPQNAVLLALLVLVIASQWMRRPS